MKILLDIGNSRLKWAWQQAHDFFSQGALDYHQAHFIDRLHQHWQNLPQADSLAIATVSHQSIAERIIDLAKQLWPAIYIIQAQTSAQKCGVKNAYRHPEKLGIDRWLALIAAHHKQPGNCWVVDCGTAITMDYLHADGQHKGGLICPGLHMMRQSLSQNTQLLPAIEQDYVTGLADFTEAAIYSGTLLAASGLIEQSIQNLDKKARLILTGGDASRIAPHLNHDTHIEPDLVLTGLSLYCED